jgi:hypothetical protein
MLIVTLNVKLTLTLTLTLFAGDTCIYSWLGTILEVLGSMVVMFSSLYAVLGRDAMTGGLVGLSISYSLKVDSLPCNKPEPAFHAA